MKVSYEYASQLNIVNPLYFMSAFILYFLHVTIKCLKVSLCTVLWNLTLSDSLQNLDTLSYISQVQRILIVSTGVLPYLS